MNKRKYCFSNDSVLPRNLAIDLGENKFFGLKCKGDGEYDTCVYDCDIEFFPNGKKGPIINIGNINISEGDLLGVPEIDKELDRKLGLNDGHKYFKYLGKQTKISHLHLHYLKKLLRTETFLPIDIHQGSLAGRNLIPNSKFYTPKTVIIYSISMNNLIDSMMRYTDNNKKLSKLIKKNLLNELSIHFKNKGVDRLVFFNSDYDSEWNQVLRKDLEFKSFNKYKFSNLNQKIHSLNIYGNLLKELPKRIYIKILNSDIYNKDTFNKKNLFEVKGGNKIISRRSRKSRRSRSRRKIGKSRK